MPTPTPATIYVDVLADDPDDLERVADMVTMFTRGAAAMTTTAAAMFDHLPGGAARFHVGDGAVRLAVDMATTGAAGSVARRLAAFLTVNGWTPDGHIRTVAVFRHGADTADDPVFGHPLPDLAHFAAMVTS